MKKREYTALERYNLIQEALIKEEVKASKTADRKAPSNHNGKLGKEKSK